MNKFTFWLVWIVGAGPLLLAILMYFFGWMIPQGRVHEGELITEAKLSTWELQDAPFNKQLPQWKIVLTETATCGHLCEKWSAQLEKVHIALGKDQSRVVVWKVGDGTGYIPTSEIANIGSAVWIADPMNNIVFRYSLDVNPKQLLKDMRRLLKVSRVG